MNRRNSNSTGTDREHREYLLIGDRRFAVSGHTYVCGILNVTPDSFSDGGKWIDPETALRHALQMEKEGAELIDLGGESTRPGFAGISEEEELERVLPVLEMLKKEIAVPISVDTRKYTVAKAAVLAGADMINDVEGLKADSRILDLLANCGCPCCLMHQTDEIREPFLFEEFEKEMALIAERALSAGIRKDRLLLDPGIGFAKTTEQNLLILRNLKRLRKIGFPILLGASRKRVIGEVLSLPPQDRLEGTLAITAQAVMQDIMFVRVHDVRENVRLIRMLEAIQYGCDTYS